MSRLGKAIVVVFALAWLLKEIVLPVGAAAVLSHKYMKLTPACDTAMEASWYYRQEDLVERESEVIQLLVCHEYDKTRKLLLISGLPEEYLSWLGLKSLEINQRTPEEYVEHHRFTQR